MAQYRNWLWIHITVLVILFGIYSTEHTICRELRKSFNGIVSAIDYYEDHYKDFNVDGYTGYKLSEIFMKETNLILLKKLCDITFVNNLQKTIHKLKVINKKALRIVMKFHKAYYNGLEIFLNLLLNVKRHTEHLNKTDPQLKIHMMLPIKTEEYNENIGDICFQNIANNCTIPNECSSFLLQDKQYRGYSATHTVIYMAVYQQKKCFMTKESIVNETDIKSKINYNCASILKEVTGYVELHQYLSNLNTDLFLEQITICGGLLGFKEFTTQEILNIILKLQNPIDGCFKGYDDHRSVRTKRKAVYFEDGCVDHTIGLGIAALSSFFNRYL